MNLQQLTTFCTVLSEGSMTAAADKLFLTQPAVSQQIRNLEDELGVELLVRGVRQIKPTMQGQLLFDYAKKILYLTQQAEVAIHAMSQEMSGDLRISTMNSLGLHFVSPIIGIFLKHNSNLSIKLNYGVSEKVINDMRSGNTDVVIMPDLKSEYGIEFPDFDKKFLFRDELWLVGSGKDTSLPANIDLKVLTTRPVVNLTEKYPGFRQVLERKQAEQKIELKPVFESDNVGTLKRVVEAGVGWGFLPSYSIRKQVRTGRLSVIQVDDVKYSVNINLYARRDKRIDQMIEPLYRALQQQGINS